jgi:protein-S-isoprenylcysteine O-methyltransferase Ste14
MVQPSPLPHPQVNYPPPLLYVGGIVGGMALHRWRPLPITDGPSMPRMAVAWLFAIAWAVIFLGAFVAFRRARTTLIPNRPASAFVTTGPYRFTRNPMYVSLVALYLAVMVFANSWWPLVLLPLVVLLVDRMIIAREERYLAGAFPDAFAAYAARVRRWI